MILAFHASDRGSNPSLTTIFYFCCYCFLFAFVVFILIFFFFFFIFNRIDNPPTSAFRYKITKDSRYFVFNTEIRPFLVLLLYHACITEQILIPRMKFLCSKTCLQGIYYISHNLLFKLPQIATFIAHKNKLLK